MDLRVAGLLFAATLAAEARADTTLMLDGEVPEEGPDTFLVPFEVPAGTVELEVRHPSLSEDNILDYGLLDPNGFRGWGGGNSEPAVVGVTSASRSYLPGEMVAGTWNVIIGKALLDELPARYRLEIDLRTTATLPAQPERSAYAPRALENKPGPRWYAGDFHVHSEQSGDATATLDQIAELAASRGLDFVELSDHNTVAQLDYISAAQARHPNILFIPGAELTTYHGHANGIGATRWIDHRIGTGGVTFEPIARSVVEQGGVFSINHPALDIGDVCLGCSWESRVPVELIGGVEIGTGGWKEGSYLFAEKAIDIWDMFNAAGARAAAIGGSDDHRAGTGTGPFSSPIGSPTTMVYATELSAAAIVEGIKNGRTVVKLQGPEDPMLELSASEPAEGGVIFADEVILTARVTGGAGQQLRWVKNGVALDPVSVDGDPFVLEMTALAPKSGEEFWRAELLVDGAPRTVTSNYFLRAGEGCGCNTSRPRGGLVWAGVFALALGLHRRRRRVGVIK